MKELKRSRTNAVIAGVCGGIGEYLEIDPNVIRLIWVVVTVFTVGVGVIAYLLAWLIVPEEALARNVDGACRHHDRLHRPRCRDHRRDRAGPGPLSVSPSGRAERARYSQSPPESCRGSGSRRAADGPARSNLPPRGYRRGPRFTVHGDPAVQTYLLSFPSRHAGRTGIGRSSIGPSRRTRNASPPVGAPPNPAESARIAPIPPHSSRRQSRPRHGAAGTIRSREGHRSSRARSADLLSGEQPPRLEVARGSGPKRRDVVRSGEVAPSGHVPRGESVR